MTIQADGRLHMTFVHHRDTGPTVSNEPRELWLQNLGLAIEIIFPGLALIVCILRGYIRVVTKNLGWDDFCIFIAMIFSIAQCVGAVIFIKVAYVGIHQYEIPPHDPTATGIWAYINGIVYNPILALVKVSVLAFLLRLARIKSGVKVTIWILIAFTLAHMLAHMLGMVFACYPIASNWDHTIKKDQCIDMGIFTLLMSSITVVTDLATLAVPFWAFLSLRMAKKAKIALLVVFALGFIVTIISIIRLWIFTRFFYAPKAPDGSFSIVYVISAIENNLAVIVASGPALWPLARRWFPGLFSNLGLSRGYQGDIPDIDTAAPSVTETDSNLSCKSSPKTKPGRTFTFGGAFKVAKAEMRAGSNVRPGVYTGDVADGDGFGREDVIGNYVCSKV